MVELEAPNTGQGQAVADPVTPIIEQLPTTDPVGPTMEDPLGARPMSPGGGVHDKGNPTNLLGYKEAWTKVETSTNPIGVGTRLWGMRQVALRRIRTRLPNK